MANEMDPENCRLSQDFGNLRGVESSISFSDGITIDDVESVILTYPADIVKRKGVIK